MKSSHQFDELFGDVVVNSFCSILAYRMLNVFVFLRNGNPELTKDEGDWTIKSLRSLTFLSLRPKFCGALIMQVGIIGTT